MQYSFIPVLALATFALAAPTPAPVPDGDSPAPEFKGSLPPAWTFPEGLKCNSKSGQSGASREYLLDAYQAMLPTYPVNSNPLTTNVNDETKPYIPTGPGACTNSIEGDQGVEIVVCNDDPHNNLVVSRNQLAPYVAAIYQYCGSDPELMAKSAYKRDVSGQYFITNDGYNFNVVMRHSK